MLLRLTLIVPMVGIAALLSLAAPIPVPAQAPTSTQGQFTFDDFVMLKRKIRLYRQTAGGTFNIPQRACRRTQLRITQANRRYCEGKIWACIGGTIHYFKEGGVSAILANMPAFSEKAAAYCGLWCEEKPAAEQAGCFKGCEVPCSELTRYRNEIEPMLKLVGRQAFKLAF